MGGWVGRWVSRWLGGKVGYRTKDLLASQRSHHDRLAACTLVVHTRCLVPVPPGRSTMHPLDSWHGILPVTCAAAAAAAAAAGEGSVVGCALLCGIVFISNGKIVLSHRCIF